MNWLRLWHDARTDRKLEALDDAQFRVFVNLLIFASEQPERGLIRGKSAVLLAVEVARGDVELLAATLGKLAGLEIIACDQDGVDFLHWDTRQPSSDDAAKRQRASRASRRAHENVTPSDRDDAVTVTPMSRDGHVTVRKSSAPDTDTEIETSSPTESTGQKQASGHDSLSVADTSATEKKPTRSGSGRTGAARRRALLVAFEDVDRWRTPANSVELAQRVTAARALLESTPPVTPDEVPRLVARWDIDHDPELCTPMALARNLSQLRGPPAKPNGRRRSAVFRDDRTAAQKAVEPVRSWHNVDWRLRDEAVKIGENPP